MTEGQVLSEQEEEEEDLSTGQRFSTGRRRPWWLYVSFLVGMGVVLAGVAYSYTLGRQVSSVSAPLLAASIEIRVQTTRAHLWLEEVLTGDANETPEKILAGFDAAAWYANAMLVGDVSDDGVIIPTKDPNLRASIAQLRDELAAIRVLALERLEVARTGDAGPGTAIDQRFDDAFETLLERDRAIERALHERVLRDQAKFEAVEVVVFVVGTAITIAILIALILFETRMRKALRANAKQAWVREGEATLERSMRGEKSIAELLQTVLASLAEYTDAKVGSVYAVLDENRLRRMASYAFPERKGLPNEVAFGEGLVGQAALENKRIVLTEVPEDYITVSSGLGEIAPRRIVVLPVSFEGNVRAVLELAYLTRFPGVAAELLDGVGSSIGIAIHSAYAREELSTALERTREQSEELRAQQEELRVTNEQLEGQTQALRSSEAELRAQQEELRASNEALAQQAQALEKTGDEFKRKNAELERAQVELETQRSELEVSGKYKSEFLANMSHELRTPLNSLILLAGMLEENREENLTDDQLQSVNTIIGAAKDLLSLINEVLDLSKVEAGHMKLNRAWVKVPDLLERMQTLFAHVAEKKGVRLAFQCDAGAPQRLFTDAQRLEQILKNLLSNALKFTDEGSVVLRVGLAETMQEATTGVTGQDVIAFAVSDTGTGIPEDQQARVFEAFQQGDGSTSRPQGGTGLGLSISRQLAKLLSGNLTLSSTVGKGSLFTLFLPMQPGGADSGERGSEPGGPSAPTPAPTPAPESPSTPAERHSVPVAVTSPPEGRPSYSEIWIEDDRCGLQESDRSVLVIEDDPRFATIVRDYARGIGFKALMARDGESGLHMAKEYMPSAILLDIRLPGIDGLEVLSRLKDDSKLRHIPVHIASAHEMDSLPQQRGAIGVLRKPASLEDFKGVFQQFEVRTSDSRRKLLIIEDDAVSRKAMRDLVDGQDIEVLEAESAEEGLEILRKGPVGCLVLDLGLKGMSGFELLDVMQKEEELARVPVVIHTGRELTEDERKQLDAYAQTVIVKSARSAERLVDETALFLHRVEDEMPERQRRMIQLLHNADAALPGKTILLVDDDMRNSFALRKLLQTRGANVILAEDGAKALAKLDENPDTDLVLMDIMMPVMDGYEATRRIRGSKVYGKVPVIALTAKAMPEDRDACLAAGANDYLTKPLEVDRLLSVLRVWLQRS